MAQEGGISSGAASTSPAPIHFDLKAPTPPRAESLPTAATLDELTYAKDDRAAAQAAPTVASKPVLRRAAKPAPRPAPRAPRKSATATAAKVPWMSEWRRAYIAKHGHQPPVPVR
jgi:hypothetical protein